MMPNSLRTRGANFAFLFGPARFIKREEASEVHGAVCDALGLDDIGFRYSTSDAGVKPESRGVSIVLERKEGRGAFGVQVDHKGPPHEPIRLLMAYVWPPTREHLFDQYDAAATAVFEHLKGNWQRVLAEARIRAQCTAQGNDGLAFLRSMLRLKADAVDGLGSLSFAGVRFETRSMDFGDSSLDNPKRQLAIELLKEEPSSLYVELVSTWQQLPESIGQRVAVDASRIRPIDRNPQDYLNEAFEFLNTNLGRLAELES